ncbi:MAG: ribosomal protein S18-alanine N-acetyltransferase [Sulfurimonas sp.]|nr:ribosomal protein S18-alanine N-acetyltransferase [Sulfurimonas sp.]
MTIRRALGSDAKKLYELEKKLFSEDNFPLSQGSIRYHLKSNLLYLSELQGNIAGYVLVLIKRKNAKLYSIGVDETHRGKKIANELLESVFKELATLGFENILLEVRVDNYGAISLYKKRGFEIKKILKEFYGDGCNAYLMELNFRLNLK